MLVRQGAPRTREQLAREALEVSSRLQHPLGVGVALAVSGSRSRGAVIRSRAAALGSGRASPRSGQARGLRGHAQEAERLLPGEHRARGRARPSCLRQPEVAALRLVTQCLGGLSLALDGLFAGGRDALLASAREANARTRGSGPECASGGSPCCGRGRRSLDQQAAAAARAARVIGELPLARDIPRQSA